MADAFITIKLEGIDEDGGDVKGGVKPGQCGGVKVGQ
jgi:hypothetical protein